MASITAPVDATLKSAWLVEVGDGRYFARGHIYGDSKRRWSDGHPIYTSFILEGPDENGIIRTMNSVYKLELLEKPVVEPV